MEISYKRISQKPIKKKIVYFEDINFDEMYFKSIKKHRQILFHRHNDLVYKTFASVYEFANNVEMALDTGYYDQNIVPNFYALIQSRNGQNRGYLCHRFKREQMLEQFKISLFSIEGIQSILKKERTLRDFVFLKYRPDPSQLNMLLYILLSRSLKSRIIFCGINICHIWLDANGYYILDLESIRPLEWLFTTDKEDPEYLRKISNKKNFNSKLKELIEFHGLIYPHEINSVDDIPKFWDSYVEQNKIGDLPQNL